MEFAFGDLNYFAVAVAIVLNMALGAIWYGPAFGKPWMALNNLTEEMIREKGGATKGYIVAVIVSAVIAFVIALLAEAVGVANAGEGAILGAVAGVGFVMTTFGVSYVFESKPVKH
ncbi:MAG: DUF1761 domain-containing protein, partial [Chloroflexota bacterium]|nr:DUF1761 domain-containing protein [Chloroflexota bacterium]